MREKLTITVIFLLLCDEARLVTNITKKLHATPSLLRKGNQEHPAVVRDSDPTEKLQRGTS
jgi:hypothetical protein